MERFELTGEQVKQIRQKLGLASQQEFANACGVSQSNVAKWELRGVAFDNVIAIIKAFRLDSNFLSNLGIRAPGIEVFDTLPQLQLQTGRDLTLFRSRHNLKQGDFSRAIGLSNARVSQFERAPLLPESLKIRIALFLPELCNPETVPQKSKRTPPEERLENIIQCVRRIPDDKLEALEILIVGYAAEYGAKAS